MKFQRKKVAIALGVGGVALVAGGSVVAQDIRVNVTGTNIKRVETETAAPIETITREDIQASGLQTIQDVVRQITANNNGSIAAHSPRPNTAPYTATKHGVLGLTKSGSLDGRRHDIAVCQIDIGSAATEMTERMAQGAVQADGRIVPEPRLDVQHVASAVLYMASLPLEANCQFLTVMATKMPFVGRG